MYLIHSWFRRAASSVLLTVLVVATAAGQKPERSKSTKSGSATLLGHVIDTVGTALPDAEVIVTSARDSTITRTGKSDARGEVTIRDLPAGGPYVLLARKIGYGAARGTDVYLKAKDTLRVDFELPAVGVTLPTVTVVGRRSANVLTAEEINTKQYHDALSAIAWKRPYMLGDPDRCRAPDPPPGVTPSNNNGTGRRPWLNGSRFYDVFNPPYSPYVQRVYVNGIRIDIPGQSALRALHDVPSSQIAEMRYVDCTDMTDAWPYSIYIVLKAPSREVQDSILRAITGRDPKHD